MAEQEDTRQCEAMRKMFVGGLNRSTTSDTLKDYFTQFGAIVDHVVIVDPQTKVSRGFGFITYGESDSLEAVFERRPHVIDGKTLDVKRSMPREFTSGAAHMKTTRLFVGGLGETTTVEELEQYLYSRHPQGTVLTINTIDLLKEKDSQANKGFGFIHVATPDQADRLMISEAQFVLNGRTLSIKKAEPKSSEGNVDGASGRGGRGAGRGGGRGGHASSRGGRGGSRGGYSYDQSGYTYDQSDYTYDQSAYDQSSYNGGQSGYNGGQGGYNGGQGGYNGGQGGYNGGQGGYNGGRGGYNGGQGGYNGGQGGYNGGQGDYSSGYSDNFSSSGGYRPY